MDLHPPGVTPAELVEKNQKLMYRRINEMNYKTRCESYCLVIKDSAHSNHIESATQQMEEIGTTNPKY